MLRWLLHLLSLMKGDMETGGVVGEPDPADDDIIIKGG